MKTVSVEPQPVSQDEYQNRTGLDPESFLTQLATACRDVRNDGQASADAGDLWLERQLPRLLAQVLVSEDGKVQTQLLGLIQAQLAAVADIDLSQPRFRELSLGLQRLAQDKELVESIECFTDRLHPRGQVIVRAALQLPISQVVSSVDAKRCLVSALLSHLRQGPAGSCFATAWCVALLANKASACITDWQELLTQGFLSRTPLGETMRFPCTLKTTPDGHDQRIRFQPNDEQALSRRPLFRQLEKVAGLGVQRWAEVLDEVVEDFGTELPGVWPLSRSLENFAWRIAARLSDDPHELELIADCLRLCAQSNYAHPLLRCWEATVASMAESEASSHRNSDLQTGLEAVWQGLGEPTMRKQALAAVLQRSRYLYDPAFSFDAHSEPWHQHKGAFVLHDTQHDLDYEGWKPVINPQAFQAFVNDCLQETSLSVAEREALLAPLLTDSGIQQMLPERSKKRDMDDTLKQYRLLDYSPWVSFSGNNDHRVRQVYHNRNWRPPCRWLYAQSETELLWGLVSRIQSASRVVLDQIKTNQHFRLPVSTARHSFTLPAGHPRWAALITECDTAATLHQYLRKDLESLGEQKPSQKYRARLEAKLTAELPDSAKSELAALMHSQQSYRELREQILERFAKEGISAETLDALMLRKLAQADRARVNAAAIPIADLNYRADAGQDSLLAAVYNPFSEQIGLWTYRGGQLSWPANKEKYLSEKTWELECNTTSELFRR